MPTSETITLRDGAVEIDATYVYADLGNSSGLAQIMKKEVTAKIMRSYLAIATRTLRYYNGFIRSFDGDRVMGIFVGANKETSAVRAALAINWAAYDLLKPKIGATWTDVLGAWKFDHGIGIDTGMAMLVRGGVRNDNDIISIGSAPNVAAKLSEIRDKKNIMITQAVYTAMSNDVAFTDHTLSVNMWQKYNSLGVGGSYFDILGSSYKWRP
ncbi:MAG TPA: adenylate/guanylate cyclase domain-containing protein [Candidatus Saccharimonadales bacterium]